MHEIHAQILQNSPRGQHYLQNVRAWISTAKCWWTITDEQQLASVRFYRDDRMNAAVSSITVCQLPVLPKPWSAPGTSTNLLGTLFAFRTLVNDAYSGPLKSGKPNTTLNSGRMLMVGRA